MKYIPFMTLIMALISLFACDALARNVKTGEQFTLKTNQSATVKGTKIRITLNRVSQNAGKLDFSLAVKYKNHLETYSQLSSEGYRAGGYKIEIVKTDPAGQGSVTLIVNQSVVTSNPAVDAATGFIEKFGWHIDESAAPVKTAIEFPDSFAGLPFNLYQIASQNSGLDMTPLLGKKLEMLKYTLVEKQHDHGADYTIYAHLVVVNDQVAGAWRTDSSSRAPGIYSLVKK